jgi:transposase
MFREVAKKQKYLGGSIKAFRSTAADVVDYIEKLMIPFYVKRKFHGLAHECSEDSDGVVGCPDAGQHFSVAYVPPPSVSRFELLRSKQRTQRQWQRAAHRHLVYSRSKKAQTEAGENMLSRLQTEEQLQQQQMLAAADAWVRFERQMQRAGSHVPFQDELGGAGYKRKLSNKYLIWDCASTHGAVRISSFRKKSFWHSYALKAGMKGVIFLPPRTPTLNPIELAFGFVKHHVRKQCPDEGYTSVGLLQAIHNAFRLITPQMIKNWVKKAGYRFTSPREENRPPGVSQNAAVDADGPAHMDIDDDEKSEETAQEIVAQQNGAEEGSIDDGQNGDLSNCYSQPGTVFHRKRSIVCMDEHGTIIRKNPRRSATFDRILDEKLRHNPHWATTTKMENIVPAVNQMKSVSTARVIAYATEEEAFRSVGTSRRWSGLGPEPARLQEMMPESIIKVQDGTLWEIDGIVEHKQARSGSNEYLVRYKGYGPEYDEWLEEDALNTAVGAVKEYWARFALLS